MSWNIFNKPGITSSKPNQFTPGNTTSNVPTQWGSTNPYQLKDYVPPVGPFTPPFTVPLSNPPENKIQTTGLLEVNIGDMLVGITIQIPTTPNSPREYFLTCVGRFRGISAESGVTYIVLEGKDTIYINPTTIKLIKANEITDEYMEMYHSNDKESVQLAILWIAKTLEIDRFIGVL